MYCLFQRNQNGKIQQFYFLNEVIFQCCFQYHMFDSYLLFSCHQQVYLLLVKSIQGSLSYLKDQQQLQENNDQVQQRLGLMFNFLKHLFLHDESRKCTLDHLLLQVFTLDSIEDQEFTLKYSWAYEVQFQSQVLNIQLSYLNQH